MKRVYVVVKGPTEESFVKNVLAPCLWPDVYLTPLILGSPGHKGGNVNYARVKKDVVLQLKQDRDAYCTTMIDLYGLKAGCPGTPLPPGLPSLEKVCRIEAAMHHDLIATLPDDLRVDVRFLPYLQLHEYESLLFSAPEAFAKSIHKPHLRHAFQEVRSAFQTAEDIDDGPETAPSKRIEALHPAYRKPVDGTLAAAAVGIAAMRADCPHFRSWIERLEAL